MEKRIHERENSKSNVLDRLFGKWYHEVERTQALELNRPGQDLNPNMSTYL